MVTKTYETDEFILKYEVDGRKTTHTFTDHRDKEVTINHLWFFDPELVENVTDGSMLFGEVAQWCLDNWEEVNRTYIGCVDSTYCYMFFDGWSRGEVRDYADSPRKLPYIHNPTDNTDFILCGDTPSDEKPTYIVTEYLYGGSHFITGGIAQDVETTKWNKFWNYTKKMDPSEFEFFRTTPRDCKDSSMFGLELEFSTTLTTYELDHIVQQVEPKQKPFFIFKQDSSVSGCHRNKYELVTVPCTMRYLKQEFKKFFMKLEQLCSAKGKEMGEVFDLSTNLSNGIHIHVSKTSFLSSLHERKFLTAFNQWDKDTVDFLTRISKRPGGHVNNSYCTIDGNYNGYTLARRLKQTRTSGRSVAHNNNSATVEVRVYQGIFNLQHLLQCLEMTEAMREFTEGCGFSTFGRRFVSSFENFILKSSGYKNLKEIVQCV